MIRFPSVAEYIDAFRRNREIFVTGCILGAAIGVLVISLKDEGRIGKAELELAEQQSTSRRQADEAAKAATALNAQVTELQRKVAMLAQRNDQLEQQAAKSRQAAEAAKAAPDPPPAPIPDTSVRILVELFKAPNYVELEKLSKKFEMNFGQTQHFVDVLVDAGLIEQVAEASENDIPIPGSAGYFTTPKGRTYVVQHGLDKSK
jgi:hypothetical protein